MSKTPEEYEKQVDLAEDALRHYHLTGRLNFREMAVAVLAALSIRKPQKNTDMKNLMILLLITVLGTSCLTVKRIERNCDKFAKVCITGIETETIYRDTTIYRTDTVLVPLPFRDTVKITDTVKIINNLAWLPTVHKKFGLIGVDAGVTSSILNVNAYLTDSTILYHEIDTVFLNNAIQQQSTTNTVVVEKRFIPKFYRFTFWIFILEIILLFAWLFVKYKIIGLVKAAKIFKK